MSFKQLLYKIGKTFTYWSGEEDTTLTIEKILKEEALLIGSRAAWLNKNINDGYWDYLITATTLVNIENTLDRPLEVVSDSSKPSDLQHTTKFTLTTTGKKIKLTIVNKDTLALYSKLDDAITIEKDKKEVQTVLATYAGRVAITSIVTTALQLGEI